jgi:hypothetical protein
LDAGKVSLPVSGGTLGAAVQIKGTQSLGGGRAEKLSSVDQLMYSFGWDVDV